MNISNIVNGLIISTCMFCLEVSAQTNEPGTQQEYDQWLKQRFVNQHEALIPVVAVADMFYACNKKRNVDPNQHSVKALIIKMDRNLLADKLAQCLNGETVKSETALNFGLTGCFHEQLQDLPQDDRQQKMIIVERAIAALTYQERQKSFTQCVTDQAIDYLK